jgi:uncharacterized membrane protein
VRSLYTPILVTHVLIAVLGLGSIASVALLAAGARRDGNSVEASRSIGLLLRYSAFSLATMLITGILLDLASGGAFREAWWFRGSAILLLATGVLLGQARRALRSVGREEGGKVILRRVERIAYGMCAFLAAITVLMEVKPFR